MQNCILLLGGIFQASLKGIIPRTKALIPVVLSSEGSQEEAHRAGDVGQVACLLLRVYNAVKDLPVSLVFNILFCFVFQTAADFYMGTFFGPYPWITSMSGKAIYPTRS